MTRHRQGAAGAFAQAPAAAGRSGEGHNPRRPARNVPHRGAGPRTLVVLALAGLLTLGGCAATQIPDNYGETL